MFCGFCGALALLPALHFCNVFLPPPPGLGSFTGCDIFGNAMPNVSVRGDSNPSFLQTRINNGGDSGVLVYVRPSLPAA